MLHTHWYGISSVNLYIHVGMYRGRGGANQQIKKAYTEAATSTLYIFQGVWLCSRVTAAWERECPCCSWGLKLSYQPLLSSPWAPHWTVLRSTTLPFWQSHTDDGSMSSFLPLLPTGPQAREQAMLLFLVVLLLDCCSCLISVPVLWEWHSGA